MATLLDEILNKEAGVCAPQNVLGLPLAHRPSKRLRKVRNTIAPPFRVICKIFGAKLGADREEGTGFLVSNKHVLTAAHILLDSHKNIVSPGEVQVLPGDNDAFIPFEMSTARKIHLFPGYTVGTEVCPDDIALIETENFVLLNAPDAPPGFWGVAPNTIDSTGTSVGTLRGWRPGHYRVNVSGYRADSELQRRSIDTTLSIPKSMLSTLPKSKQDTFLFIRNDVRRGMSGSPVWVRRHRSVGGRIAVAMVLGMDEVAGRRYAAARLITDDVIQFIAEQAGKTVRQASR